MQFDRYNRSKGAAYFNSGYYQVASGIYFYSNDFTVSVWTRFDSIKQWQRIIDFGNGQQNDNILITIDANGRIKFYISKGKTNLPHITTTVSLTQGKWYHVACVLKNTTGYIYINGVLSGRGAINVPNTIIRTLNFIGRSNWQADPKLIGSIDDLQIYNTSLTQYQINEIFRKSY